MFWWDQQVKSLPVKRKRYLGGQFTEQVPAQWRGGLLKLEESLLLPFVLLPLDQDCCGGSLFLS